MKESYTISEVSKMIKESHSLLRFWEQKFDFIDPKKNNSGERIYSQKDIDFIKKIHFLVKKKGYTLEGAARLLKKFKNLNAKKSIENLRNLKLFFEDIIEQNN